MKKINLIVEIVLAAALVALYAIVLTSKDSKTENEAVPVEVPAQLPIAYINVDTLLSDYSLSLELNEQLLRKRENLQANFNQKARQLEKEVADFQYKLENNVFSSAERAQNEQNRLVKKQQDLQNLDQKLSNELQAEMARMNERLTDSIYSYLSDYNKLKGYQLILSNTANDNILIGAPAYNITQEVLEGLNDRYNQPAAKKSK